MTATPGRIRRSIRFAQLDARTDSSALTSSPRRERITGTERLNRIPCQNVQDWVNGVGTSPSGRFRVIEEPQKRQKIFGKTGMRADLARAALWALGVILCVSLLVCFASVGSTMIQARKLETRITAAQSREKELKGRLSQLSGDISVCTRAVELNLISSGGAPTIQLTAPGSATMNLVEPQESQATQEPDMKAALGTADLSQGD